MEQVTVSPKYQIVIPKKVRRKLNVKPGDKVLVGIENKNKAIISPKKKSWAQESLGIAKEAWKNINTTKYLEDLRNEWEKQ